MLGAGSVAQDLLWPQTLRCQQGSAKLLQNVQSLLDILVSTIAKIKQRREEKNLII